MSLVFLIGMPASGKSYWGKIIAKHYNWNFVDMDESIVEKTNRTIEQIFREEGEGHFRGIETEVLKDIVSNVNGNLIVATGGGVVLSAQNIEMMQSSGCIIYLETPLNILVDRVRSNVPISPLLTKITNLELALGNMLISRKLLYEQADYIFEYKNISVINFGEILSKCIDQHSL